MGIFRNRNEEVIDLSDDGLIAVDTESTATAADLSFDTENVSEGVPAESNDAESMTTTDDLVQEERVQREDQWKQAALSTAEHWPQVKGDLRALVSKMVEISRRYGDDQLWQRAPEGLMREAAMEMYGLPKVLDSGALSSAVRQAHEHGMQFASRQAKSKAGLAPSAVRRSKASVPSEEERIINQMRKARRTSIF